MGPVRNTPIQDIRSDPTSFQSFIIFTLNRISQHTFQAMESERSEKLIALEAEIGFLDSFLGPYYSGDYDETIKALEKKIDAARPQLESGMTYRLIYQRLLRQWVKEIIKRLGSPSIGILPAIKTGRIMGEEGEVNLNE